MTNYKQALIASAPTAAWVLDSNTSTDPDLSLNGLNAAISVADRSSLPVVSGASRAYTFNSILDTVYYPSLNIWASGQTGRSFSVEFVIKPLYNSSEVIIFAPLDPYGIVPHNKISIKENKLSFIISDASNTSDYTDKYEAYSFIDFSGGTYHCVATYEPNSISLYINGELVSNVAISNRFKWTHTALTGVSFETRGNAGSTIIISGLAVHKSPLPLNVMAAHYRALMYRQPPKDIVSKAGGRVFQVNDEDREKMFYFNDPNISKWQDATLNNLSIVNNKLTLDEIEPPTLNTGTAQFIDGRLSLQPGQYLTISNVDNFFAENSGSFGFYVKYDAAIHGVLASGELGLVTLTDSSKNCIIEVVEKSDKKIYLRYTSNGITASDALIASPSTGVDSDNYLFVSFSPTEVFAQWNDINNQASIDTLETSGMVSPSFDSGSSMLLGNSMMLDETWDSDFWWLNIWSSVMDLVELESEKDLRYEYTLKLESSLNVSQRGWAEWELGTGYSNEEAEIVNQSRVWWTPSLPSEYLLVQTGTEGIGTPSPGEAPAIEDTTVYFEDYIDSYGESAPGYAVAENMVPVFGVGSGAQMPETIYVKATLFTDDSVNNIVFLKKIGIDIFRNSECVVENGEDRLFFNSNPKINFSSENIGLQDIYQGNQILNNASACRLFSKYSGNILTDDTDLPEVSDSVVPPTELSAAKTIEFWMKPYSSTSGTVFNYDGGDVHQILYNGSSRVFTVYGFDKFYIDGVEETLTAEKTASKGEEFNSKWHILHAVMADQVDQQDYTVFPAVAGSPTIEPDNSKAYFDLKSLKMTGVGSSNYIEVLDSIGTLNTGQSEYNSIMLFVYPDAGVTSVRTNYRVNGSDSINTHTVVPEKWNLIERYVINSVEMTTVSIRIGTISDGDVIWLDGISVLKGSDTCIRFLGEDVANATTWFGYNPSQPGLQSATFDIQNIASYYRSLTDEEITENVNNYLGNLSVNISGSENIAENLVPIDGYSMEFPTNIVNRNPDRDDTDTEGDLMFNQNPILLSSGWKVLSTS